MPTRAKPIDAVRDWIRLAAAPSVVRRGLGYALVVGAVLVAINHGEALLRGQMGEERTWRIGLTVLVPYVVSTLSSVGATRRLRSDDR